MLNDQGIRVLFLTELRDFLHEVQTGLVLTQPPLRLVKRQGRETEQSPPSGADVTNSGARTPLRHTCLQPGFQLFKGRETVTRQT